MTRELLVDFNALPRLTRARLVNSTSPVPSLAPIAAERGIANTSSFLPWFGLAALCFLILFVMVMDSFGQPTQAPAQSGGLVVLYVGFLFLFLVSVITLIFRGKWRRALPFHPGRYLFPFDVVDARTRQLRIIPLSDLAELQVAHHGSGPSYSHASITLNFHHSQPEVFQVHGKAQASIQLTRLRQIRAAFAQQQGQQDEEALRKHDLFFEVRAQPGGLESLRGKTPTGTEDGPLAYELSKRARKPFLFGLALAVSLVLGPSLWFARNVLSDDAAFAMAKADRSERALYTYVRLGWRHTAEARELGWQRTFQRCEQEDTAACWKDFTSQWLDSPRSTEAQKERLPRAALKATPRSVAALEAFLKQYPRSVVDAEVRERLIPEAAFQELPPNNVAELRRFRKKYPGSVMDAQAEARIRELFAAARTELQNQASTQNRDFVPFMSQLLSYFETTERSLVLVSFRRHASPSLLRADVLLRENARYFGGSNVAAVSGHFAAANTSPIEATTVRALKSAFQQIFPEDLLSLEQAEYLPAGKEGGEARGPRIDIDYTISWSGTAYQLDTGRQFAGIQFDFDVTMRMADAKPVRFKLRVKPPKHFNIQYTRPSNGVGGSLSWLGAGQGPSDYTVYDVMAQRAFDELGGKLGTVFFRRDSKAFQSIHGTSP